MLDIRLVRERPEVIREMLGKRRLEFPLDRLLELDRRRRQLITEAQELKHRRNVVSAEISRMKREGVDVKEKVEEMRDFE